MALTLVATVGGANSNSYATVAEGDTYHESRLNASAWTAASSTNKAIALVMATRTLDTMYEWEGAPSYCLTTDQALSWPRWAVLNKERDDYIAVDVLPVQLKNATIELARQLLVADRTIEGDIDAQGIKRLKAGSVDIEFSGKILLKPIPDAVQNMIPTWWGLLKSATGEGFHKLERR